jgi:hypothetical protein
MKFINIGDVSGVETTGTNQLANRTADLDNICATCSDMKPINRRCNDISPRKGFMDSTRLDL